MTTFSNGTPIPLFHRFPWDAKQCIRDVAIIGSPKTIYEGGYFKVMRERGKRWAPWTSSTYNWSQPPRNKQATMSFPEDYPFNPPTFRFNRDFYHPNGMFRFFLVARLQVAIDMGLLTALSLTLLVYPDGRLCISILHPPGDDPVSGEKAEVSNASMIAHWIGVIEQRAICFRNDGIQHR